MGASKHATISIVLRSVLLLITIARSVFAQDVTPPTLISTTLSGNIVTVTFSEPMSTDYSFAWIANKFVGENNVEPQAWSADKRSATVWVNLPTDTAIVFVLNVSEYPPKFRDLAGNFLAPNTYTDDVANSTTLPPIIHQVYPTDAPTPSSLALNAGANADLRFIVLSSKPRTVQWLRNGVPIPNATNQFLQLTNVSGSDAGNYVLTVTNSFGSSSSSPIAVSIVGLPMIATPPQSQTATAGANVTFQVSASGSSPLFYQWQLNGTNIAEATSSTFTVNSVTLANAGDYSVIVSNSVGSVTSTPPAVLTVNRLSQTITFGSLETKQIGDAPFNLEASASSGLPVSYSTSNPNVATISGNTVTIVGAGTSTITANQAGNATYLAASAVNQTLTVATGTENKVLFLSGSSSYVRVPNSAALHSASQLTVEAWIYPESAPANQSQYFISKGDGGSVVSDRSYHINWKPATAASPGFNIEMFFNQNNYAYVIVPAVERKWIHVALTFNSAEGVMKFYTNGVLAAQQTKGYSNVPLLGQTIRQSSQDLVFGNLLAPPAAGGYAKGLLDEVRIWSVSRNVNEILLSMQSKLSGNEPNLLAYWNFDSGILADVSGNGHQGQSNGNAAINLISGNDEVHAARLQSIIRQENGMAVLRINLATNLPHTVAASSNFLNWTTVTNVTPLISPLEIVDSSSTNVSTRFYRVTAP